MNKELVDKLYNKSITEDEIKELFAAEGIKAIGVKDIATFGAFEDDFTFNDFIELCQFADAKYVYYNFSKIDYRRFLIDDRTFSEANVYEKNLTNEQLLKISLYNQDVEEEYEKSNYNDITLVCPSMYPMRWNIQEDDIKPLWMLFCILHPEQEKMINSGIARKKFSRLDFELANRLLFEEMKEQRKEIKDKFEQYLMTDEDFLMCTNIKARGAYCRRILDEKSEFAKAFINDPYSLHPSITDIYDFVEMVWRKIKMKNE